MAIHATNDIKEIHTLGEPRPPKLLLRSMWRWPLTVTTCLTCHKGCIGSLRKACDTSDLNMTSWSCGLCSRYQRSDAPRECKPSSLVPLIESESIMEFNE